MVKTPNNSIVPKKSTKDLTIQKRDSEIAFLKSPWLQEYLDPSYLRISPVNEKIIDIIAQELLDWSCDNETFTLTSFLVKKRIHRQSFYAWKEKFPKLKFAYDISMMAFVDRREVFGLLRKIDPGTAFNSLAKYDDEWKEFVQWKSNLSANEGNNEKVVIEISDLSKRVDITSGSKE